jgi:chromate transport protein ChrA
VTANVRPTLRNLTAASFKVGCLGFGGPAGQIALMHRVFVDEKKWIDEDRYLHALSYCTLLPGPEAQQLATYLGWLLHGVTGGIIAGLLFVLPGAAIVFALSWIYVTAGQQPLVAAAFLGIKAASALVLEAMIRVARALKGLAAWPVATPPSGPERSAVPRRYPRSWSRWPCTGGASTQHRESPEATAAAIRMARDGNPGAWGPHIGRWSSFWCWDRSTS